MLLKTNACGRLFGRKQLLGVPIHMKMSLRAYDTKYYTILVLKRAMYTNYIAPYTNYITHICRPPVVQETAQKLAGRPAGRIYIYIYTYIY